MTNVSALPAGASETPFLLSQPALLQTPVLTALLTPPCPLSLILFIAQRCVCWCFLGPLSLPPFLRCHLPFPQEWKPLRSEAAICQP